MYDYADHGNIDFSDTEPPKHDFGDAVVRVIRTRDIYQVDPEEHMDVYSERILELAGDHRRAGIPEGCNAASMTGMSKRGERAIQLFCVIDEDSMLIERAGFRCRGDIATIAGAMVVGGIVAAVVGVFVKKIRRFFPPIITGTVVFTIGLSLYPTAINYMAGGTGNTYASVVEERGLTEALVYGSWQNWAVAAFTLTVVLVLTNHGKGICRLASILLGILAGYAAAFIAGMVDLSGIGEAAWFSLPQLLPFGITFEPSGCIALGLLFAINSIQAIGDLTATTVGGMDRQPTDRELQGGIVAYGVSNILTALLGGLPTATYSQNVGIVATNKVVNRWVFALTGGFLLLAGVVPKFSAVLTTIPQCVIGGATISVFATITMTGIRMITEGGFTPRKSSVVGLSVALGVGITQVSGCLAGEGFPAWVNTVFGSSSVVVAALMAILLNLILPKEPSANG